MQIEVGHIITMNTYDYLKKKMFSAINNVVVASASI